MSLLDDIQKDLLGESSSTASTLRKARVLADRLESPDLRQWAKSELEGYGKDDELPNYRKLHLPIVGTLTDGFRQYKNFQVPSFNLPDDLREMATKFHVTENVAAVEGILNASEDTFERKHPPELTGLLNKHLQIDGGLLESSSQKVPKYLYSAILDSVKSRLLEFVLELQKNDVNPDEPNSERTDEELVRGAVVNHIYGNNNTVAIGDQISQQVSVVQKGDIESLFELLKDYQVPDEDLAELKDAISAEPDAKPRKLGPRVSGWIGGMMAKAASGAWNATAQEAPALVRNAVDKFYGG